MPVCFVSAKTGAGLRQLLRVMTQLMPNPLEGNPPEFVAGSDRHAFTIDGRNGASIENIGSIQDAQDLAENLRIGALPIDLKLISQTQVSATLGQQALDQGLTAAAAGRS